MRGCLARTHYGIWVWWRGREWLLNVWHVCQLVTLVYLVAVFLCFSLSVFLSFVTITLLSWKLYSFLNNKLKKHTLYLATQRLHSKFRPLWRQHSRPCPLWRWQPQRANQKTTMCRRTRGKVGPKQSVQGYIDGAVSTGLNLLSSQYSSIDGASVRLYWWLICYTYWLSCSMWSQNTFQSMLWSSVPSVVIEQKSTRAPLSFWGQRVMLGFWGEARDGHLATREGYDDTAFPSMGTSTTTRQALHTVNFNYQVVFE